MFEHDGLGVSSVTDYFSYGEVRETGSQYGTFGNISYALDAEYQYNDGIRPNNRISRLESYGQVKVQLGPQDTLFFQTKYEDLENRRHLPALRSRRHDPTLRTALLTFDFHERQDPALLLLGWHHEWSPENHTLILVGRLANHQTLRYSNPVSLLRVEFHHYSGFIQSGIGRPFGNPQVFETLQSLIGQARSENQILLWLLIWITVRASRHIQRSSSISPH